MNKIIGFIGCGNMAQAIIGGIITSNFISKENVIASNPSKNKLDICRDKYGIEIYPGDNISVAKKSDILVLAVKPHFYSDVIKEIKDYIKEDVLIVTIAAGVSIDFVEKNFFSNIKVIRTMPNTAALVNESITLLCKNSAVSHDEFALITDMFNSIGKTEIIPEAMIDKTLAIGGSSPALVYMFIEAMADGAVLQGVPRDKAYKIAAQAVLGSAKMVLETNLHPGALKDMVCSPGGTTIEAVYTLEKNNFRGSVIEAVDSCTKKAIKMNSQNSK